MRCTFIPAFIVVLTASSSAFAAGTIKSPGNHPDYTFELEPHLVFGLIDLPGIDDGRGLGPGLRATIELVDNGFIKSINNTVGIGFGADMPAMSAGNNAVWVPVVMQWNFWLSDDWSVFGEPGFGTWIDDDIRFRPAFYAGGRYLFSDSLALTLRVGYPAFSVGLSFL